MILTKLGVSQKQASKYANAAAAATLHARKSGSPHAAISSSAHEIARDKAPSQLVSGMMAKASAAAKIRGYPPRFPASQAPSSASGNRVSTVSCGPSPYLAST